jgi:nucleoside-specific outer membrane channel protein Tsx
MRNSNWTVIIVALVTILSAGNVLAADWSVTEVQLQVGDLDVAYSGGETSETKILTYQHASGWKYGDNFFFADLFLDENDDQNIYTEWYPTFSIGKIGGIESFGGPLKDIGVILGLNYDGDADVLKFLPGIRFALNVPGFAFLNTDFTAYIDAKNDNGDIASEEENSFMIDVSWALPFKLGSQSFSFEGHMEYIHERERTSGLLAGTTVESWFLAQPQLRWDIGEQLFKSANQLFIGVEYQYWMNKLGDADTDESALQGLLVWRF